MPPSAPIFGVEVHTKSISNANLDSVLEAIRVVLSTYLAHTPDDGDCKLLTIDIKPSNLSTVMRRVLHQDLNVVSRMFHAEAKPYAQYLSEQKTVASARSKRDGLDQIRSRVNRVVLSSFGCDKDTTPGVVELHAGLDIEDTDRPMAVALYETARDLFAEWLAGMHSHIPWGLRFIQGEDIFCSANRWPMVHIDPEYPPIPDCGDRGLRALFGRDGPKARTPGVIEQSSVPESAEPVDMLYYDTLEDLQAEWRAGKHEHIPLSRRGLRNGRPRSHWETAVRYTTPTHLPKHLSFPSDYPGRPLPLDQVPECDDPEMARLWGSERQNAPCWLGYVWTGRRQYDGDLPASMDPADWWYPTCEQMMHDWLQGVLDNVPFKNRRYFSDHGWRTDPATRAYFEERDKNFTMTFTFHPEDNTPIPDNIPQYITVGPTPPPPKRRPSPNPKSEPAESRKRAKVAVEPASPPRRSRRTRTKRS